MRAMVYFRIFVVGRKKERKEERGKFSHICMHWISDNQIIMIVQFFFLLICQSFIGHVLKGILRKMNYYIYFGIYNDQFVTFFITDFTWLLKFDNPETKSRNERIIFFTYRQI